VSKNPFAVEKCNLNEKSKTSNIPYDKKQAIYNAVAQILPHTRTRLCVKYHIFVIMGRVYFISVLFSAFFAFSCGGGKNEKILSRGEMTDLLVDISISEVRLQRYNAKNYNHDIIKKQSILLYREVFEKHNTTYETYQKSVEWYMEHPKIFKEISENADKKLLKMRDNCE
jgi:hypothetical protein